MNIARIIATSVNIPLVKPSRWAAPGMSASLDTDALKYRHNHFGESVPLDHSYDPAMSGKFRRLPLN